MSNELPSLTPSMPPSPLPSAPPSPLPSATRPLYAEIAFERFGNVTLRLSVDVALLTFANFVRLASEGYYNNSIVHRSIAEFMIQGGGFSARFEPLAAQATVLNEAGAPGALSNSRGTIAMARTTGKSTATTQWFINQKNNGNLDHSGSSDDK